MSTQITVRLDDGLHEQAVVAATDAGTSLSDWVRLAVSRQVVAAKARRARGEEDTREVVYTPDEEEAIMVTRRCRAVESMVES